MGIESLGKKALTFIGALLLSLSMMSSYSPSWAQPVVGVEASQTQNASDENAEAPQVTKSGTTPDVKEVSSAAPPSASTPPSPKPQRGQSLTALRKGAREEVHLGDRLRSLVGLVLLLTFCWLLSNRRNQIPWRVVGWGIGLQLVLGFIVMKTSFGSGLFSLLNGAFTKLLQFSNEGATLLFGGLARGDNIPVGSGGLFGPVSSGGQVAAAGAYVAFSVLPTIIFFSALMAILYHCGLMERIVKGVAWVMQRTMHTSGSETLSVSGNIFVGQTEAPLLVRPYIDKMTESELMTVMTGGFATVAGGVMAAYVGMLSPWFPDIAGHLLSASVMSAPAALVCAKLMIPEPDPSRSETYGGLKVRLERIDANIIDAAARGAIEGLKLTLNVGAMLLAFIALVALANFLFAVPSYLQHLWVLSDYQDVLGVIDGAPTCLSASIPWEQAQACALETEQWAMAHSLSLPEASFWPVYTMQSLLGFILQPIAWLMGVSWEQASAVGQLLGLKTIINEFVAYGDLAGMLARGEVSGRSAVIATYALCGFANFGSIAIQIGGIAPNRRGDLARLGVRAMIGGTIAAMLTATVAGLLY
ncbi:MAG: nucleoside transporter C-terminal domain-containing protein [Myxococcota bacterium]|nr:nucleoside transporter C-terminal domain-containing protein [Myxococcota bacterium]